MGKPDINYYKIKNRLFKPMSVIRRNRQRLEGTTHKDTLIELLKNAIEHGTGKIEISINEDAKGNATKLTIFNKMERKFYRKLSFRKILEDLTSFQEQMDSNFHEGLTTLLLFQVSIRAGPYYISNRASGDGYFQYIDQASHYLDNSGKEITIKRYSPINGWEVSLNNPPKNSRSILLGALDEFYFLEHYRIKITINGKIHQIHPFKMPRDKYYVDCNGFLHYSLHPIISNQDEIEGLDPNSADLYDGKVLVYWRLKNRTVFQKLETFDFNHRNVDGIIILTSVKQFANEKRIELHHDVRKEIEALVLKLQKKQENLGVLQNELKKYPSYKKSYIYFLERTLNLPKNMEYQIFDDTRPEQSLIFASKFIYTLRLVLNTFREYQVYIPHLFNHPDQGPSIIKESEFRHTLEIMGITLNDFRAQFAKIPLGLKVLNGEPEGFMLIGELDDFMENRQLLQIISSKIPFQRLVYFDNDVPILYPTNPLINFFISDIPVKILNSPIDFRKYPSLNIQEINQLQEYAIYPQNTFRKGTNIPSHEDNTAISGKTEESWDTLGKKDNSKVKVRLRSKDYFVFLFAPPNTDETRRIPLLLPLIDFKQFFAYPDGDSKIHNAIVEKYPIEYIWKQFSAITRTVEVIVRNFMEFPPKPIYPIMYSSNDQSIAKFLKTLGIIAFNVNKFPRSEHRISDAVNLIDILCHELAHEFAPNHGRTHEKYMERMLRITRKKDQQTNKHIIDRVVEFLENN